MIVADSNTILYFFIPGKYTVQAKAVFKKDCQWVHFYGEVNFAMY